MKSCGRGIRSSHVLQHNTVQFTIYNHCNWQKAFHIGPINFWNVRHINQINWPFRVRPHNPHAAEARPPPPAAANGHMSLTVISLFLQQIVRPLAPTSGLCGLSLTHISLHITLHKQIDIGLIAQKLVRYLDMLRPGYSLYFFVCILLHLCTKKCKKRIYSVPLFPMGKCIIGHMVCFFHISHIKQYPKCNKMQVHATPRCVNESFTCGILQWRNYGSCKKIDQLHGLFLQ